MQTETALGGPDVRGKAEETASAIARQAEETATTQLSSQKERAASTLDTIAQTLRDSGQNMRSEQPQIASLTDEAARRVQDISSYVREHDVKQLVGEVESFARREPALFLGGAFAIGFLAARFLKASSPTSGGNGSGQYAGFRGQYSDYRWQPEPSLQPSVAGASAGTGAYTTRESYAQGQNYGSAEGVGPVEAYATADDYGRAEDYARTEGFAGDEPDVRSTDYGMGGAGEGTAQVSTEEQQYRADDSGDR